MKKYIYILLGSISLTLGLLGIITPGLPTTPFILLTGFLYAKGSPRLHQILKENKITGYYLNRVKGGLSIKARLFSLSLMWAMVSFTAFFVFDNGTKRFVMLGLGLIGTIAQLIVLRKKQTKVLLIDSSLNNEVKVVEEEQ